MYQVIVHIQHTTDRNHPPLRIVRTYQSWEQADTVFEKFHELYKLGNNCVSYVEFNEIRDSTCVKKCQDNTGVNDYGSKRKGISEQGKAAAPELGHIAKPEASMEPPHLLATQPTRRLEVG